MKLVIRFFIICIFSLLIGSSFALAEPPKFTDFPVKEIYKEKVHPAQKGEEYRFDTLKQVLETGKVNFAGHYIVYMDGCGTGGCIMYSIADAKTGKDVASIPRAFMGDVEDQYTPNIEHQVNSKLLHVSGVSAEKADQYYDEYYVLKNNRLKKIAGTVKTIKSKC